MFGIAAGADGNLWFTGTGKIGRITTAGVITQFSLPSPASSLGEIAAGPDDNLWFTEGSDNKIGRITTAGAVTEFTIPTNGSYPYGIAAGPDGNLWFTESNVNSVNSTGKIGRMTMSGVFSEFALSPANRHPFSVAAGPDGKLWFAEGAGKFGRITTAGVITEFMLPAAGGARSIAAGPDGALWFTEQVSDRIGRLSLAGSACMQLATNLCLNNARFQVEATWKSSDGASSGQAVSMTPDAGYFWFFSPNNPELVVKALDACSINGRSWLLVAGLTDVQVLLTVTDMQTGQVKTYTNPQHTLFQPILDASGFACP